ncbi:hypothetical protein ANN_13752 [Periplaneta americana]|uniref:Uncharacterized protein n=1 Tax=Periplaneta americana TaxID=6978 RepID=A0ABQ8SUE1_PERAM|nr:hypothetical protein ANN_13752 [Periplaneta americana]
MASGEVGVPLSTAKRWSNFFFIENVQVVNRPIPGLPTISTREEDATLLREIENHPLELPLNSRWRPNFQKRYENNVFEYPDLPSSLRSIAHNEELLVSPPLRSLTIPIVNRVSKEEDFSEDAEATPHFPTQKELNYLIRDLGLIKSCAELLTSRLKVVEHFGLELQEVKVKGGIFVGTLVKKLLHDDEFIVKLLPIQRGTWKSFRDIVKGFLGNRRMDNYREVMQGLLKNYTTMGCRKSLKLHVLQSHLDIFKSYMDAYSEE